MKCINMFTVAALVDGSVSVEGTLERLRSEVESWAESQNSRLDRVKAEVDAFFNNVETGTYVTAKKLVPAILAKFPEADSKDKKCPNTVALTETIQVYLQSTNFSARKGPNGGFKSNLPISASTAQVAEVTEGVACPPVEIAEVETANESSDDVSDDSDNQDDNESSESSESFS